MFVPAKENTEQKKPVLPAAKENNEQKKPVPAQTPQKPHQTRRPAKPNATEPKVVRKTPLKIIPLGGRLGAIRTGRRRLRPE